MRADLSIAAVLLTLAAPASAYAASTEDPIVPQDRGLYPVLTVFTGPCEPEPPMAPPPSSGEDGYSEERKVRSVYSVFTANGNDYDRLQPTPGPQNVSGPCQAYNEPQRVGGVAATRAEYPGNYSMTVYPRTTTYQNGGSDHGPVWSPVNVFDDVRSSVAFTVFDPCSFQVSGTSGTVQKYNKRKRTPVTVRRGDTISRGDTLYVASGGKATLSNVGLGSNLGFGPGEYQFEENEACTSLAAGRRPARMPDDPAPVKLKEGTIEQRGREAASTVKAGRDLSIDGIFSRLGGSAPKAAGSDGVRFRVQRSKRRKRTKACAIAGDLQVTTKSRRVRRSKRRLVVPQGRCAVTRDRAAPKLVRR